MAFYRTHELFSLVSLIFVLLSTNVHALSFNFPKFTSDNSAITLQGDTQILTDGVLALTNSTQIPRSKTFQTVGRALYTTPVPLWDSATGNVASFVTSFSFVIKNPSGRSPTDGLVFFIAPPDTVIPNNSNSQYFGIVDSTSSINRFVGVEFDIFRNPFDPSPSHIGIDINSLISTKTVRYNYQSGSLTKATITYDSPSNALTAVVTYENGKISTISQEVDLKAVLPNTVRVGFSASSTIAVAFNIHSWSFTSNLEATKGNIVSVV